jgi:hypothetical protein
LLGLVLVLLGGSAGCGSGPRNFLSVNDPSPVVRARAVGLEEGQPDEVAVPALIERLGDPDAVVRMTAQEALKRRTGQDFGFVPWEEPAAQAEAIARWRAWWESQQGTRITVPSPPVRDRQVGRAGWLRRSR